MKHLSIALAFLVLTGCTPDSTDEQTETKTAPPTLAKVDKILLEEWFDYGCHYCEQTHPAILNLKEKYGERLEVIPRHYPLSAQTTVWAEASECARDQDKFDEFHNLVFSDYYGQFDPANITKAAEGAGVPDLDTFKTCVTSGAGKDRVVTDIRAAEKVGVKGTPFFLINKDLEIPGAISQNSFENLFNELLGIE